MKKISLFTLLFSLLFVCNSIKAQDDENNLKNFRFGLHATPAIAWYKPDNEKIFESNGSKLKFAYGLSTEFRLNKVASFATGLNINYSGGTIDFVEDSIHYSVENNNVVDVFYIDSRVFNTVYVDIPLTLKMKTPEIGAMTYFGQFGANLGILTKARADDKGTIGNTAGEVKNENVDISKDMSFLSIGLNVGAGAEYNLAGSTSLVFSVNYHNGFTNILQKKSDFLTNKKGEKIAMDVQSNYLSLTIGVLF
jgi:hypothetical protein